MMKNYAGYIIVAYHISIYTLAGLVLFFYFLKVGVKITWPIFVKFGMRFKHGLTGKVLIFFAIGRMQDQNTTFHIQKKSSS